MLPRKGPAARIDRVVCALVEFAIRWTPRPDPAAERERFQHWRRQRRCRLARAAGPRLP